MLNDMKGLFEAAIQIYRINEFGVRKDVYSLLYPCFNKVERRVYWFHPVRSMSYGRFFKFVTLTLSSFDLGSNITQ